MKLDNHYGIINEKFEEIIPPTLETINNYDLSDYFVKGYLFGERNDSTILFDTIGSIFQSLPEKGIYPHDYFPEIIRKNDLEESILKKRPHFGSKNPEDDSISFRYSTVYSGINNQIIAEVFYGNFQGFDIYDEKGEFVCSHPTELSIVWRFKNLYWVRHSIHQIVPMTADCIIDTMKIYEGLIEDGCKAWVKMDSKWGLIDSNFNFIIEPTYDFISIQKYWNMVDINGLKGFTNSDGKLLTDVKYTGEWTQYESDSKIIVAYIDDNPYFLNEKGESVLYCEENRSIKKYFPSGQIWVEGEILNNHKVGVWNYYRNDSTNSLKETKEYLKQEIVHTYFDPSGNILDQQRVIKQE